MFAQRRQHPREGVVAPAAVQLQADDLLVKVQVLGHGFQAAQQHLLGAGGVAAFVKHHRQAQPGRRTRGGTLQRAPVERLRARQRGVVALGAAGLRPAQRLVRGGHRAPVAPHVAQAPGHRQQRGGQGCQQPGARAAARERALAEQASDRQPSQQRQRRHQRQAVARDDEERALHEQQHQERGRPPAAGARAPGRRQSHEPGHRQQRVRHRQRAQGRRRARPAVERRELIDLPALQVQPQLAQPQPAGAQRLLADGGHRRVQPQAVRLRQRHGWQVEAAGQELAARRIQEPRAGHHRHVEAVRLGAVADVEVHPAVERGAHRPPRRARVVDHRRRQRHRRAQRHGDGRADGSPARPRGPRR